MCQVIEFNQEQRAAEIVADLCHQYGYCLTTTQSLQVSAVNMVRAGMRAADAARHCARPPQARVFSGFAA
jgi:hypothetical protein